MASNEREGRRYIVKIISSRNQSGTSDEAIGSRAADMFLNKVRRRPGGKRLLKKLSHDPVDEFGIPESSYAVTRMLAQYSPEVWEWYCAMTSHILDQGPAERYVRNKRERVTAESYFKKMGLHGKERGFVMKRLYDMAVLNAQLRRKPHRRSI